MTLAEYYLNIRRPPGCQRITSQVTIESIFSLQRLSGDVKYASFGDSSLSLTALALKAKLTVCSSLLASASKVLLCWLGDIQRDTKVIQWQRHEWFWILDKTCRCCLVFSFVLASLFANFQILLIVSIDHIHLTLGWVALFFFFLTTKTKSEHTATFSYGTT